MRKLVFEPYTEPPEGEKVPTVVRTWGLIFQALNNPAWRAGDDMMKVRAAAKLLDKFETVQDVVTTEQMVSGPQGVQKQKMEKTRLKFDGGTVLLEDAEFDRLEDAWKQYRANLPGGAAVEIVRVNDFLDKAPTVETKA